MGGGYFECGKLNFLSKKEGKQMAADTHWPLKWLFMGVFLFFLLRFSCVSKQDSLEFITFEPAMPGTLKVKEPLKVYYTYTSNSSNQAKVFANFLYRGKHTSFYENSAEPDLKPGSGKSSLEVFFTKPLQIDQVELYIIKTDTWSVVKRALASYFDNVTIRILVKTAIQVTP